MNQNIPTISRYVLPARLLHWIMAAGFFFMWLSGYIMTTWVTDDSPLEETLFGLHFSIGGLLLALLVCRAVVRYFNAPPAFPPALCERDRIAAHFTHMALYLLPLSIIGIGWAEVDFGGHGLHIFGLAMPKLFPTMESWNGIPLESTTELIHKILAYLMLALTAVHIAAAILHRGKEGEDVLPRMSLHRTE